MKQILKFSARIVLKDNRASEIAQKFPSIIEDKLRAVIARDLKVNNRLISFHGGQSRSAPKRSRLVTNWNLLSPISRGAIQIEENYSQVIETYWTNFPNSALVFTFLGFLIMSLFIAIPFFNQGESIFNIFIMAGSLFVLILALSCLGIGITLLRFFIFVKLCIYRAKKEIHKSATTFEF
jgi:hypothetical protein